MSAPISADHSRLIHQLELVTALTDQEKQILGELPLRRTNVAAGSDIAREGDNPRFSCVVLEGVACRYKLVGDGVRQILSFHFAGDIPDLQTFLLDRADYSIAAVTAVRVAFIDHETLERLISQEPGIAQALARHALVDASIFREWIANVGRRQARARISHLLCEFYLRTRLLGLLDREIMVLPLTQTDLADATGMSVVHVNRTMQQLRREGLIRTESRSRYSVTDWPGLQRAADFNPAYLHLRSIPRGLGN